MNAAMVIYSPKIHGESLAKAAFIHHDNKVNSTIKHHTALNALKTTSNLNASNPWSSRCMNAALATN